MCAKLPQVKQEISREVCCHCIQEREREFELIACCASGSPTVSVFRISFHKFVFKPVAA